MTQTIDAANNSLLRQRWLRLAVASAGMFFAGVLYAWSIFKVPLGQEFCWTTSQLAFNYTLTLCCYCVALLAASPLMKYLSTRYTILLAAAAILAGFALTSTLSGNIVLLYFAYAFLSGAGIGIAYNTILSTAALWFPDKKGICSGILQMSFGITPLVVGTVADTLFQIPAVGWRKTFLFLGILIAAVLVVCSFVVIPPPTEAHFPTPQNSAFKNKESFFESRDYSTAEAIKLPSFWCFFLYLTLFVASGSTIIGFARDLALFVGAPAALATTLVGVLSLFNGMARIVSGLVLDRFGHRVALRILSVMTATAPIILLLAVLRSSVALCICGMCLAGFSFGFLPPICVTVTRSFYGVKHFSSNFGTVNLEMIPASFGSSAAGALLTATGSYTAPLIMLVIFTLGGSLLTFTIRQP